VYLINNAGVAELAVSGVKLFPDQTIQSTSTIGAGSTSGTTLYSTTARSNVAIRLVGRLLVNEATAGTWASNPTEILSSPPVYPTILDVATTTLTPSAGFGTTTVNSYKYSRVGDTIYIRGLFRMGTTAASTGSIALP